MCGDGCEGGVCVGGGVCVFVVYGGGDVVVCEWG